MDTLVLGGGVSGLTTAIRLREAGYPARIVTRERASEAVSAVAPAMWHPYRAFPPKRVLPWARRTLEVLLELLEDPGPEVCGVYDVELTELFGPVVEEPPWVPMLRHRRPARADELPPGFSCGWVVRIPRFETPVYLAWLEQRFEALGGTLEVVPEGVSSLDEVAAPDRLVVNATGLGARKLAADEGVYPISGQTVRVTNPGLVDLIVDEEGPLSVAYVIPRTRDVILGGTAEKGDWDRTPDPEVSRGILARTRQLVPRLAEAEILEIRVGLRPGRAEVRLEREDRADGSVVIHNYGHGGAGFTCSWGCAEEVVALARAVGK